MTISRVRFREKQVLRAQDLAKEQSYRVGMQQRHELGAHTWGIAAGLNLLPHHDEGMFIQPGMAVDGYGRHLIISEPVLVKTAVLDHDELGGLKDDKQIDVWLVYNSEESQPGRIREEARIRLELVHDEATPVNPYQTSALSNNSSPVPNHENKNQPWPVYLGRIRWSMKQVQNAENKKNAENVKKEKQVTIIPVTRPMTALRGEMITAVSGQTQMQIGGERSNVPSRFTVSINDHKNGWKPHLAIDQEGKTAVYGDIQFSQTIQLATSQLLLRPSDILNPARLTKKLLDENYAISRFIASYLPTGTHEWLGQRGIKEVTKEEASKQLSILVNTFNFVIEKTCLLNTRSKPLFFRREMDEKTRRLLINKPSGSGLVRLNRWFLESWLTGEFQPFEDNPTPASLSDVQLQPDDILDPFRLLKRLSKKEDLVTDYILSQFPENSWKVLMTESEEKVIVIFKEDSLLANLLSKDDRWEELTVEQLTEKVVVILNQVLESEDFLSIIYAQQDPEKVNEEIKALVEKGPEGPELVWLNRYFLQKQFTDEIKPYEGDPQPAELADVQLQDADILDLFHLLTRLTTEEDDVAVHIRSQFTAANWEMLNFKDMVAGIVTTLNQILGTPEFTSKVLSQRKLMDKKMEQWLAKELNGPELLRLNRHILNIWYPGDFAEPGDICDQERGVSFAEMPLPPETAVPWGIYRTVVENEEERLKQLRFEIGDPNVQGDPANSQLVIGYQEPQTDNFITCFSVSADGNVIVYGNLQMQPGNVISEGPIDINLADERFTSQMLSNWVGGLSTAAPQVDAVFNTPLELSLIDVSTKIKRGELLKYSGTVKRLTTKTEFYNLTIHELVVIEGRSPQQREIKGSFNFVGTENAKPFGTVESSALQNVDASVQQASLIVTVIGQAASGQQVQATATRSIIIEEPEQKG